MHVSSVCVNISNNLNLHVLYTGGTTPVLATADGDRQQNDHNISDRSNRRSKRSLAEEDSREAVHMAIRLVKKYVHGEVEVKKEWKMSDNREG